MKRITTKANVIADIFSVLSATSPKELSDATKDADPIRTVGRFSKLTDAFELPEVKAANDEKDTLGKAIRAEIKPFIDGKTTEEVEIIAKPFNDRLNKAMSDVNEKHGLDKLSEKEVTVEISDEAHKLLLEVLPVVGKSRFVAVKPFAAALEAVEGAVEA